MPLNMIVTKEYDGKILAVNLYDGNVKYEFEGKGNSVSRFDAFVTVVEPRARVEGERISFDCELAFSICAVGETEICAVTAVKSEGAERKERKGITVCYPDASESLWSIAKRYGAPFEDVARENGLDRAADADEISMPVATLEANGVNFTYPHMNVHMITKN